MNSELVTLDGSYGSGGGQILRTAVGLAALTGKSCKIFNLRAGRPKPGLQEQHLQALRAAAQVCQAQLEGAEIGSIEIIFQPGKLQANRFQITIATAGSVGLVLQPLLIMGTIVPLQLEIHGGATFGKWAPPLLYITQVLAPLLHNHGCHLEAHIKRDGF